MPMDWICGISIKRIGHEGLNLQSPHLRKQQLEGLFKSIFLRRFIKKLCLKLILSIHRALSKITSTLAYLKQCVTTFYREKI